MDKIFSVMAYYCIKYPYKNELSKARLTKLVYLSDWFHSLIFDSQITGINWLFNHYGPYVDDVAYTAEKYYNYFKINYSYNCYGGEKSIISYIGDENEILLTNNEKEILNAVIEKTKTMYFNDFINYVYSTYPVKSRERYSYLDLKKLAREYLEIQKMNQ